MGDRGLAFDNSIMAPHRCRVLFLVTSMIVKSLIEKAIKPKDDNIERYREISKDS